MTIALLAFALLSEPTPSRDNSFSIVPPYDWAVLDRRAGGVDEFIARVRKKNRRFGGVLAKAYVNPKYLFFAVDELGAARGSIAPASLMVMRNGRGLPPVSESMLAQFVEGVRGSVPQARATDRKIVRLPTGDAAFVRMLLPSPPGRPAVPQVGRQYLIIQKGAAYVFAFTLPRADEMRTLPLIERTMSSLSWLH